MAGFCLAGPACQYGHHEVARFLIERDADIEMSTRQGWTPLVAAAWAGNESVVSVLLSAGANAKAETTAEHEGIPAGSTPLSVASEMGHSEVAAALVSAGAT